MTEKRSATFGAACEPLVRAGCDPKWLLPPIPADATLASGSQVKKAQLGKVQGSYLQFQQAWAGRTKRYDQGRSTLFEGRGQEWITSEHNWPTDGVLIIGHELVLFDIDARSQEAADLILQALGEVVGEERMRLAPRRVRMNAPHRLSPVFRAAEPGTIACMQLNYSPSGTPGAREGVEWRGAGGYWVAGGSMHPTGMRFEWRASDGRPCPPGDGNNGTWRLADVPLIRSDEAEAALEHARKLLISAGYDPHGRGVGGVKTSNVDRIDVSSRTPRISRDLFLEVLSALECSPELFEGHDHAVKIYASMRAVLGALGEELSSDVVAWGTTYDGDQDWVETTWANTARGVNVGEQTFINWVEAHLPHKQQELAARVRNEVRYRLAAEAFGTPIPSEHIDEPNIAPNPGTGKKRWLAFKVMTEASRLASQAKDIPLEPATTLADWREQARNYKSTPPIIDLFVYPGVAHGLVAAPGVGKSLMVIHAAMSGLFGMNPTSAAVRVPPCHVIALFAEDGPEVSWARFEAARLNHIGGDAKDPDHILKVFANTSLQLVDLDEQKKKLIEKPTADLVRLCDVLEAILEAQTEIPIALLFDMMRNTFVGDENQRWQVDALFRVWKSLLSCVKEAGGPPIGILYTHHMTKSASRAGSSGSSFNAAGSIGIEGNSRRITEVTSAAGSDVIVARVTKVNDGRAGVETSWQKETAEVGGRTTAYLRHISADQAALNPFAIEELIADLHRLATGENAPIISHATRAAAGVWLLEEALQHVGGTGRKDEQRAVLAQAIEIGAFASTRYHKGSIDCAKRFAPCPNWRPPVNF